MSAPKWEVKEVKPRRDYTLLITFAGGEKRLYDARPLLCKAIYSKLKSPTFFLKAKADCGTVVWDDETDIAPEHLYECSVPVEGSPHV